MCVCVCRLYRPIWPDERASGSQQILANPLGCRVLPQSEYRPQGSKGDWLSQQASNLPDNTIVTLLPFPLALPGRKSVAGLEHEYQDCRLWLLQLLPAGWASRHVVRLSALRRPRGVWGKEVHGARNRHLGECHVERLLLCYYTHSPVIGAFV